MTWTDALALTKWKISSVAALSTLTGAVLFSVRYGSSPRVLAPVAGTLLLAFGACALNQVQERRIDAQMERTRGRPLPAGRALPGEALALAVALLAAGLGVLAAGAGPTATLLGAAAAVWYNGVYTYLKRVSAFAALPGALVGAVPPLLGWTAAGGALLDFRALALGAFFFVWQVPHFWLLLLRRGEEYRRAGLPSLSARFSPDQLSRITLAWLTATGAVALAMPLFQLATRATALACFAAGVVLVGSNAAAFLLPAVTRAAALRYAFRSVNVYLIILMAVLAVGRLMHLR
jgi:protoheme IX farnesyltransferase